MLFPLSKSFSSSRLFSSGGVNSDPVIRRVWSVDNTDIKDKARDLHELIFKKTPYEKHLQLARQYNEPHRRRVAEMARDHKQSIWDINDRATEAAKEERSNTQARIRDLNSRKASNDDARKTAYKTQIRDYMNWRDEMQNRVSEMPALGSEGIPRETKERAQERVDAQRALKMRQKEYFENHRAVAEKLKDAADAARQARPKGPSVEVAVEQRKTAGLRELSKSQRNWESVLDEMYGRHGDRIAEVQTGHKDRMKETLSRTKTQQLASQLKFNTMLRNGRDEIKAREARMAARGKNFGGYQGVAKSEKRLRNEEVLIKEGFMDAPKEMGGSTLKLGGTLRGDTGSNGASGQATLSPEQLASAS